MRKLAAAAIVILLALIALLRPKPAPIATERRSTQRIPTQPPTAPPKPVAQKTEAGKQKPVNEDGETIEQSECYAKIADEIRTNGYLAQRKPALDAVVGSWYYERKAPDDESSTSGKFFEALAKANLLSGAPEQDQPKDVEALKLLMQVAAEDRDNAAPWVYAAIIAERNADPQGAQTNLAVARTKTKYDSYLTTFAQTLYKDVKHPADYYEAVGVWSQVPVPSTSELAHILQTNKEAGTAVAHLLTQKQPSEPDLLDIDVVPIEYSVGRSTLNKFEPGNGLPSLGELMRRAPASEKIDIMDNPEKYGCDISKLQPAIDKMHEKLNSP